MQLSKESLIKLGLKTSKQGVRYHTGLVMRNVKDILIRQHGVSRKGLSYKTALTLFIAAYKISANDNYPNKMFKCYLYLQENKLFCKKLTSTKRKEAKIKRHEFYDSEAWQELRKKAIQLYGVICMKCQVKDVEMHVDHIKPRSLYPDLELEFSNLQILCRRCNMEKSNLNEIDYRPGAVQYQVFLTLSCE